MRCVRAEWTGTLVLWTPITNGRTAVHVGSCCRGAPQNLPGAESAGGPGPNSRSRDLSILGAVPARYRADRHWAPIRMPGVSSLKLWRDRLGVTGPPG